MGLVGTGMFGLVETKTGGTSERRLVLICLTSLLSTPGSLALSRPTGFPLEKSRLFLHD